MKSDNRFPFSSWRKVSDESILFDSKITDFTRDEVFEVIHELARNLGVELPMEWEQETMGLYDIMEVFSSEYREEIKEEIRRKEKEREREELRKTEEMIAEQQAIEQERFLAELEAQKNIVLSPTKPVSESTIDKSSIAILDDIINGDYLTETAKRELEKTLLKAEPKKVNKNIIDSSTWTGEDGEDGRKKSKRGAYGVLW